MSNNVSLRHFAALVNKTDKCLLLSPIVFENPVKNIGDEDACLFTSKGDPHEEKDNAIAKRAQFLADNEPKLRPQESRLLFSDVVAYPLITGGRANLRKAEPVLFCDAFKFRSDQGMEPQCRVHKLYPRAGALL